MATLTELLRADMRANAVGTGWRAGAYGLLLNPGFSAIAVHRIAQALRRKGWDRIGSLLWSWNTFRTGCHFHIDSKIGPGVMLPHPVGVVFGSGTVIDGDVCIYQGVTLGRDREGGYPHLHRGTTIYPDAVLVGDIDVGNDVVVGATALVTQSVPSSTIVAVQQTLSPRPRASTSTNGDPGSPGTQT